MSGPIIIFSIDTIRGRITLNALKFKGFKALLYDRIINSDKVISTNSPSVVILDTKGVSPNELDHFRSAYPLLSNTALIVLASPSVIESLELKDIRTEICKSDPLDVDLIISKVTALLSQKTEVQKTEAQPIKGPGDEEIQLEDDLKKFLDLK